MGSNQADLSSFEYLKEQSFHNTSYNLFHRHLKINMPSTQLEFPVLQLLPCSGAPATGLAPFAPKAPLSQLEKLITTLSPPPKAGHTWVPSPLLVCPLLLPLVPCHRACKRVTSPFGSALWSGKKGDMERGHLTPGETGFPQIVYSTTINGENSERFLTGSAQ